MKLSELRKIETVEDLEALDLGGFEYETSYRGGGVGFRASVIAEAVGVSESDLPRNFGAGCNYLGGGVRGSIFASSFNPEITGRKRKILEELASACVRAYENLEKEVGLNSDDDDNPNWDARATEAVRRTGIVSAY